MGFWVTSLLYLAGKDGKQCPSPIPSSALNADLGFSFFPMPLGPLHWWQFLTLILHARSLFSYYKENWQKFPCPSHPSLHLRVSSEGRKSIDPTYSTSNSTLKRSGHPTMSSHSCLEQQPFLKVVKEVTQSTFCLLSKEEVYYLLKHSLQSSATTVHNFSWEFIGNSLKVES